MRLKMKDFVLLALLTALYIIVYFVAMMTIRLWVHLDMRLVQVYADYYLEQS